MSVTFDEEMRAALAAGVPNLDNVSDPDVIGTYGLEYDGPRCAADDCLTPVENDNHPEFCEECADSPHEFRHDGDPRFPDHCVCGRIRSIGGYSPVHVDEELVTERDDRCPTCRGAGGWQQHDGAIEECPRGCSTDEPPPTRCGSCGHNLAWHVQPGGCTIGDCPCLGGAS